nr:hypothetical protein [Actinomycetota bacterium]
ETRHAYPRWLQLLAEHDPVGCLAYLARLTLSSPDTMNYQTEALLPELLSSCAGQASPLVEAAAWLLVVGPSSDDVEAVTDRLADSELEGTTARLAQCAARDDLSEKEKEDPRPFVPDEVVGATPSPDSKLSEILTFLGSIRFQDVLVERQDEIVALLGEVLELALKGEGQVDAETILSEYAKATETLGTNRVLEWLAEWLCYKGHTTLAAAAYVHAFVRSGSGFDYFGHRSRLHLVGRAVNLDRESAMNLLAEYMAEQTALGGRYGATERIVELLPQVEALDVAKSAWDAAFVVISLRLPSTGPQDRVRDRYAPSDSQTQEDFDRQLALLSFTRLGHVSLERRRRACLASAVLLESELPACAEAAERVLSVDISVTAVFLLLSVCTGCSAEFLSSRSLFLEMLVLCEQSGSLLLRASARRLLETCGIEMLSPSPTLPRLRPAEAMPGARFRDAATVWPEFSGLARAAVEEVIRGEGLKRRMGMFVNNVCHVQRRRHFGDTWSPADELEEVAVCDVAATVRSSLAVAGTLEPTAETDMADCLFPSVGSFLRSEASRRGRPGDIPIPSEVVSCAAEDPPKIIRSGSPYEWIRVAYTETEHIASELTSQEPAKEVDVHAGATVGSNRGSDSLPLGIAKDSGWEIDAQDIRMVPIGFRGPLVRMWAAMDLFGMRHVLSFHPALVAAIGLRSKPWTAGCVLVDETGEDAVVAESWRTSCEGDGYLAEEHFVLEGSQLLIRSDVMELIEGFSAGVVTLETVASEPESLL